MFVAYLQNSLPWGGILRDPCMEEQPEIKSVMVSPYSEDLLFFLLLGGLRSRFGWGLCHPDTWNSANWPFFRMARESQNKQSIPNLCRNLSRPIIAARPQRTVARSDPSTAPSADVGRIGKKLQSCGFPPDRLLDELTAWWNLSENNWTNPITFICHLFSNVPNLQWKDIIPKLMQNVLKKIYLLFPCPEESVARSWWVLGRAIRLNGPVSHKN